MEFLDMMWNVDMVNVGGKALGAMQMCECQTMRYLLSLLYPDSREINCRQRQELCTLGS